jgi:hypothetical protein
MYDLSVELADPPEVKALMEQAKAFAQKACKRCAAAAKLPSSPRRLLNEKRADDFI